MPIFIKGPSRDALFKRREAQSVSKKRLHTDPRLSVWVRKFSAPQCNGEMSEFVIFMTDLDGNVTVADGEKNDTKIFRTNRDQTRNDDRQARMGKQVRHHQTVVMENFEVSAEQEYIEQQANEALRKDLKRVLSTFKKSDPARSVLAHVLAAGTDWDDTMTIADRLGLTAQQTTVAKRKIQRRIENNFSTLRKHLKHTSGF